MYVIVTGGGVSTVPLYLISPRYKFFLFFLLFIPSILSLWLILLHQFLDDFLSFGFVSTLFIVIWFRYNFIYCWSWVTVNFNSSMAAFSANHGTFIFLSILVYSPELILQIAYLLQFQHNTLHGNILALSNCKSPLKFRC